MWTQHGYHMNTTLFPGGYHIVSMWIPCGFHVDTMWFSGGHHVVFRWTLHGFKCGHHMVSRWTLHGFHRTPHGLHMDTMWCPGNHMETSTKNQLCMKPTGFLVLVGLTVSLEIDPSLYHNQLRYPWGVNFKYNGLLHHNLARVWVVTKFNIPPISRFHLPPAKLSPDCSFSYVPQYPNETSQKVKDATSTDQWIKPYLRNMCQDSLPMFSLLEARETYLRNKMLNLVEKDLYGTLRSYQSQGRAKRFASLAISAVTGLVTLAVEGISSFLQDKRNKAMANAMDALQHAQTETYDKLQHYKDDLMLYGTYSLKSTSEILDTLENMYTHQASLSSVITELPDPTWPVLYQSEFGYVNYASHLNFHAHTLGYKFDFLYDTLIHKVEHFVNGLATLSKGYLPPKLFPPLHSSAILLNALLKNCTEIIKDTV